MNLIVVAFLVGIIVGSVGGGLEMRRRLRDEEEDRQFWSDIATRARVTEPPAFPEIPGLVSHWTAGQPIPPGIFGGSGTPVLRNGTKGRRGY